MRLGYFFEPAQSVGSWIPPFLLAMALSLGLAGPAEAQTSGNPANCEELKDPDTKFQLELCSAHVGCRMVMGIHTACQGQEVSGQPQVSHDPR